MPMYCYEREDNGRIVELFMSSDEMLSRQFTDDDGREKIVLDDGVKAVRDIRSEHGNYKNTPGNWPMKSDAAGVNPTQIPEQLAADARIGAPPTEYDRQTGQAIFRSPHHRKAYCEAHGLYDRNGGYSDPQKRR